jgi:prepilin-type N-terminal cleavage/methylation domain-containing protein
MPKYTPPTYIQKGFTLVEILIGLVIISTLFVGGYTAYREFQRRQIVSTAASEIKTHLSLARQRALSGEKTSDCTTSMDGYDFTLGTNFSSNSVSGATSYSYRPSCGLTSSLQYANSTTTINLPSGVTVSSSGASGAVLPVKFKTIANGTSLAGDMTLTITQTSTNTSKTVIIRRSGAIE